jgi:hypothetical protein
MTSACAVTVDTPTPPVRDTAKHGKRLSQQQIAIILMLSSSGQTEVDIARQVGCSQATVSRTLHQFGDGRELARKRLEGGALRLAETVVRTKDAGIALKALGKLDVVREDAQSGGNQMVVMLGSQDAPLSPPAITVLDVSPASPIAVTDANPKAKAPPMMGVSPSSVA